MSKVRKNSISNKTFKGLKFRLHHRDKQLLQNLKGLLENHYIDDLEIDQVEYDVWADLMMIPKNSVEEVKLKELEIEELKREISTLRHERYQEKNKNKELRLNLEEKDKIINNLRKGINPRTVREQRKLMKAYKIRQGIIAEMAGCSQSHVSNYLNGKIQNSKHKKNIDRAIEDLLEEYKNMGS